MDGIPDPFGGPEVIGGIPFPMPFGPCAIEDGVMGFIGLPSGPDSGFCAAGGEDASE